MFFQGLRERAGKEPEPGTQARCRAVREGKKPRDGKGRMPMLKLRLQLFATQTTETPGLSA